MRRKRWAALFAVPFLLAGSYPLPTTARPPYTYQPVPQDDIHPVLPASFAAGLPEASRRSVPGKPSAVPAGTIAPARHVAARVPNTRGGGSADLPAARRGIASWYDNGPGLYAAAGPALRTGNWREEELTVCTSTACVQVQITDWCQCYKGTATERLIDLSPEAFQRLGPLSLGLLKVSVH